MKMKMTTEELLRQYKDGEVNFEQLDFRDPALRAASADLRFAHFNHSHFDEAYLVNADLRNTVWQDAYLIGAKLCDADLRRAQMRRVTATNAELTCASLCFADLTEAFLASANLSAADLSNACLRRATLIHANLLAANLTGADLRDADLRGVSYGGGWVLGVDFTKANVLGAIGIYTAFAPNMSSRHEALYAAITRHEGTGQLELRFWAGCRERLPAEQLRHEVELTHGHNIHARQYNAAIDFIEASFASDMEAGRWDYLLTWE